MKIKQLFIAGSILLLTSCGDNDPVKEDVPEMITQVKLTFIPTGGEPRIFIATDPDGEGIQSITTDGVITLSKGIDYRLEITLINGLANPGDAAYDVSKEVEEEGDEHMFFFAWTKDVFAVPAGDGNIDNRADAVDYTASMDANGLPLGLKTDWTTSGTSVKGATFRVMLKHQPDLKSATSKSSDGETDLDITFDLEVN